MRDSESNMRTASVEIRSLWQQTVRKNALSAHRLQFFPVPARFSVFSWPFDTLTSRTYLRTAAGMNDLRRLKQSATPSSMERLAPRFAFAECDCPDVTEEEGKVCEGVILCLM